MAVMASDMKVNGNSIELFVAGADGKGVVCLWNMVGQFTIYPKKY